MVQALQHWLSASQELFLPWVLSLTPLKSPASKHNTDPELDTILHPRRMQLGSLMNCRKNHPHVHLHSTSTLVPRCPRIRPHAYIAQP